MIETGILVSISALALTAAVVWYGLRRYQNADLSQQAQKLYDQNLVLQDRVERLEAAQSAEREARQIAEHDKDRAYQMLINLEMQSRLGGVPPYPDAPHVPVGETRHTGGLPERLLPSQAARRATIAALSKFFPAQEQNS